MKNAIIHDAKWFGQSPHHFGQHILYLKKIWSPKSLQRQYSLAMSFLLCSFLYAQQQITTLPSFWSSTRSPSSEQELRVTPNQYQLYGLNLDGLSSELQNCKKRENVIGTDDLVLMRIPLPDGKTERFGFFETPVMEPALQAKYPNIRTYTAQGIDDPRKTIKMEIGPRGLQAMIFTPEGNTIISPAYEDELAEYIVFRKQDLSNEPRHFRCGHDDFNHNTTNTSTTSSIVQNPTGTELRTYRLALGTTGEYTSFHGGTKELALAAVATSMNRINGIYERDFTITMVLVANTDTLIYLDSETDPYTNNDLGAVLVIDSDNLLGTCSDGASGAAYQITSLPAYGNLFLNGIPLSIGSTFTQDDIDNMALSYEHEGGAELPDQFGFILTCSNGSYIGGLVYNITVLNPVTTDDVNEGLHWRLFPNPTNSTLTIELGEMESAVTKIQLIDVLGRVVFQQKVERIARQQFDLQQLTAGIYTCQLLSGNERVVGTKKLVVTR